MDRSTKLNAIDLLKQALVPIAQFLDSKEVQEVMINGPDDVWVEERGIVTKRDVFINENQIRSAIAIVARLVGKEASESTKDAIIDSRFDGFRIAAALSPISTRGSSIAIRKHGSVVLSLQDYVDSGSIPFEVKQLLEEIVVGRKNLIVSGGTSSGKTTFLNALARLIPETERVLTIEDTKELQILTPNYVSFESNEKTEINIRSLVKHALRYRPDRIIVGEVRGPEAFDLMRAMSTGHDGGFATLHSNSAEAALRTLEMLVLTTPDVDWKLEAIRSFIGSTFHYVIHLARDNKGRRGIKEVLRIKGFNYERNDYEVEQVFRNENAIH
ncbi:CpaF family protein [Methylophilus sp. QUAN]|uniref:CpaF family protein n=1 Tax=Methylophilus sp. QUAN TaxID=2781020 RepID=UPI001890AA62|nr:ATPase, T2SS/T4P/T4SS family [Methylophilus sp. QUAN]MBF4990994.1 CpaF family protein [Methylophilus sp. QUAN]